MSSKRKYIKNILIRPSNVVFICAYCGEPAADKEHVFPKSIVGSNTPVVWSCKECNMFAGAILFDSFEEKLDYIQKAISNKYKRQLQIPDWEEHEILELGRSLQTKVREAVAIKSWISKRVSWKTSIATLVLCKLLEQIKSGEEPSRLFSMLKEHEIKPIRSTLQIETSQADQK
jgi:hypothetical protein